MTTLKFCSIAIVALGLPLAASAQQPNLATAGSRADDVTYCHRLANRYSVGHPIMQTPNVGIDTALNECDSHPRDSIATLEKAMTDEKIALPPRS